MASPPLPPLLRSLLLSAAALLVICTFSSVALINNASFASLFTLPEVGSRLTFNCSVFELMSIFSLTIEASSVLELT